MSNGAITSMWIDSEVDFNFAIYLQLPKREILCATDEQEKLGNWKKVKIIHVRLDTIESRGINFGHEVIQVLATT